MAQARDPLDDAESYLTQLEEQVDKLIIALDEWRQWKQEYEALQKEVQALSPTATRLALARTRETFVGELVDAKELFEIFGQDDSKKRDQIIGTLINRLEYVSKNVATLMKQLEAAEGKLANTRIIGEPDAADEEGLPITEISEVLDDDDNVISYTLRRPGDSEPQLLKALETAGVKEVPSGLKQSGTSENSDAVPKTAASKQESQANGMEKTDASEAEQATKKKSVAFAEDTKPATEERPGSTVQKLEDLYRQAKEQESIISDPVMPADESAEDAELREDMIRYNKETMMYEMAPIVAELQLEEGSAEEDDWYDDSEEDDDDDEDQWGRSTSGVVDDEYRRQMLELKERLSRQTFGEPKESGDNEDDELAEGIGRITVRHENVDSNENGTDKSAAGGDATTDPASNDKATKSVRFAPSLDIAEPSSSSTHTKPTEPHRPEVDPLSDVVERHFLGTAHTEPKKTGRKPSRFRKGRAIERPVTQTPHIPHIAPEKPTDTTRYAPSGPEGQTLASTILEHEPSNEVKEPDELDANFLHQQVTEEYYKMRNTMIGRGGGFLRENTDPIQPLDEEEGGPKRVSRFRAARLAKS